MLKRLIKIADRLDHDGRSDDADLLDSIIKLSNLSEKLELTNWISRNISDEELLELEEESKKLKEVINSLESSSGY